MRLSVSSLFLACLLAQHGHRGAAPASWIYLQSNGKTGTHTLSLNCLCLSHTHARWQMHAHACAVTSSSVVDWQKQMSLKRRCCKTLCFCVCVRRRKCVLVWAETHDEMKATEAWPRLPCNATVTLHLADGQISVEPVNSWSHRQQLNECLHKIRHTNTNKLIAFWVVDGSLLKTHRPAAGVWAGCRPERDWRFL